MMKLDVKHIDFDWNSCGEALAGLPQDAVVSLMDDYYNSTKKGGEVCLEYGVTTNIRRLPKEFPKMYVDLQCPYDGSHLTQEMPTRNKSNKDFLPTCPVCGHNPVLAYCPCPSCRKKFDQDQAKKEKEIQDYYTKIMPKKKVDVDSLSATEQLYLAAMGLALSSKPIIDGHDLRDLAPIEVWSEQIVENFIDKGVLVVDPSTPSYAFED